MKRTDIVPLKEKRLHGTDTFPCAYYQTDDSFFFADMPFQVKHHWHEELEIVYFQHGSFHAEINMQKYDVCGECFFFVGSGDLHYIYANGNFAEKALVFSPSMLFFQENDPVQSSLIRPLFARELSFLHILTEDSPCFSLVKANFLAIAKIFVPENASGSNPQEQYALSDPISYARVKAALLNILADLAQYGLLSASVSSGDRRIDAIKSSLSYMKEHLEEKIYVRDLSGLANMNEQYFCRFFKKMIGKSPMEYLGELRIRHACTLLKETNHSVMDICLESGFNNLGNFLRTFKKICGCTPLQYRKKSGVL
ncbi:MAG: AraC family transcriptional regulator [Eubacteriales bacterium]|nr:AraC family transcriptional regulator [Eubacteriales bacterium]